MKFTCLGNELDFEIGHVVVAGWTGRDTSAVQHHIDELAALGVYPPSTIPLFYRVSATTLTQSTTIEVLGQETSGEVEPLLLKDGESFYIGLGSDHTDRKIEAASVAASKQICPKPVSPELWPYEEIADHLDHLVLRSSIMENGDWTLYQQGELNAIRPITELIKRAGLPNKSAMLCGTLGAIGGVRPAGQYKMELEDPVLSRSITLAYNVKTLPEIK